MAVKVVEMVRKIRDKHYEETKDLSVEKQIKFVRDKAKRLQRTFVEKHPSTANGRARKST
jgi:hypothetical protein